MKRVGFSLAIVLLLAGAIGAAENPIDKGSMILGGSVYFMTQSGDLYEYGGDALTTIALTPSLGYFVAPSIMVGGEVSLLSQSQGDESLTSWAIGPMVGYYFNIDKARTEVKGAIYPYVKGFFLYGQISNDESITQMSFGGQGGVVFMLSTAVGVDGGVRFQSDKLSNGDSISGTTLWVGAGITAFLF